jgi:hypothetical protein
MTSLLLLYWIGVILIWCLIGPLVDRVVENAVLRRQSPFVWDIAPLARLLVALVWPGLPVLMSLTFFMNDKNE